MRDVTVLIHQHILLTDFIVLPIMEFNTIFGTELDDTTPCIDRLPKEEGTAKTEAESANCILGQWQR